MRKIVTIFLTIAFFVASFVCVEAAGKKAKKAKKIKTKQAVEFTTKDKFNLSGDIYLAQPKTNKPLVVLLHSFSMNSNNWLTLPEELRRNGYNVLVMDLRGHGRSIYSSKLKYKSRYSFQDSDWQKLPSDVIDSINYVKNNYTGINTIEVIIAGADIGANAGVLAAVQMKVPPKKMVLISPMYEFKGLKMPIKSTRFQNTRMLMLLSGSDRLFFEFNCLQKPVVKRYPKGGPGLQLMKANPTMKDDIIKFIMN